MLHFFLIFPVFFSLMLLLTSELETSDFDNFNSKKIFFLSYCVLTTEKKLISSVV